MVKNTSGGNRSKKLARKNVAGDDIIVKTRLSNPKEPCEMYANVTKMFGQGNCEVMCNDGRSRLCVIRNKFKGRNKSRNMIYMNSKLLIGTRDWEIMSSDKKEKCDLLHVYTREQFNDIRKDPDCNWSVIASQLEKDVLKSKEQDDVVFEFIRDDVFETIAEGAGSGGGENVIIDDINFDDI